MKHCDDSPEDTARLTDVLPTWCDAVCTVWTCSCLWEVITFRFVCGRAASQFTNPPPNAIFLLYCVMHGAPRRRSAAARLMRLWVRIPPGSWMSVCSECCVLSGRGLCDELIARSEEPYRLWCVVVCDLETSWMRRPWPTGDSCAKNKTNTRCMRLSEPYNDENGIIIIIIIIIIKTKSV